MSKAAGAQLRQPQAWRFMAVVSVVLIIITIIIVITIWLAVQPKQLIYSIEHSSINGYNYTSGGRLNATFHCLLRSKNPNKRVSFYFDKIDVRATYYDKELFVGGKVDPFYQPVRNVTDLEVDVAANGTVVAGSKAAEDLRMERASGNAKLEVKINGKIRMKIGVFKVRRTVRARCGPYDVPFSESMGFKRTTCDTEIYY
ncbi:hypothetical protein C2S52_004476 [Perilla frutescens var. hirtella]|uniref:Late embryogenesis abundant protein LEA-2 subgroup domain-containing protein n=1 Tax=Perilla frutescens var. hirtella TaxID=608512 RepID=A0AAD4J3L6_PERFH|nr:hypothetical protein C2S51_011118 [Perilla frutescens var. frutescens]KAH6793999.1 hypothetical protein C2S52_004476 [Perilla frutescens var. hirtella]KAH6826008.1 hypothetical protein C2S53_001445 [Perilla frutescens var. hirtella]